MDARACSLLFPTELLEKIIFETWSSHLSTNDRITFMTSSLLVNHIWKALFIRIAFTDVHIPCPSYLEHYLRALAGYSSLLDEEDTSSPDTLCRSITFQIQKADATGAGGEGEELDTEPPMGKTLTDLLYRFKAIPYASNLRTLCVQYENMEFDDVFEYYRFIHFPAHVTNLEISFSFDQKNAALGDVLRATHERQSFLTNLSLPGVKTLVLSGASDAFVADMISCCPNRESVTILPQKLLESSTAFQDSMESITGNVQHQKRAVATIGGLQPFSAIISDRICAVPNLAVDIITLHD
ncbi:hypothetical protein D9615_003528 [Tricholomella constricta]|uniref:Uncharacterized protein n=1 Tax=Tricholomella constricta TaxID=117010 RepID=A0A8H5M7P9_9AGAR|nr:hypothetical protein D9615_003528 [Tricholomella constricta]